MGRIALGCHVDVVFSEEPGLSTAGEVYLLGEPYLDETQRRLGTRAIPAQKEVASIQKQKTKEMSIPPEASARSEPTFSSAESEVMHAASFTSEALVPFGQVRSCKEGCDRLKALSGNHEWRCRQRCDKSRPMKRALWGARCRDQSSSKAFVFCFCIDATRFRPHRG
jgi:hypothetical protein